MKKKLWFIISGMVFLLVIVFAFLFLKNTNSESLQDNLNGYQTYRIGQTINFAANGNSQKYIGKGWSGAEQKFTWTDGKDAYVNLFLANAKDKKLQLNVFGYGIFGSNDKCQNITVYINNSELTTWCVSHNDDNYMVEIPQNVINDGANQIRFHIDKPVVLKNDPRHLGFNVKSMYISHPFAAEFKIKIARWIKNKVLKAPDTPKE